MNNLYNLNKYDSMNTATDNYFPTQDLKYKIYLKIDFNRRVRYNLEDELKISLLVVYVEKRID